MSLKSATKPHFVSAVLKLNRQDSYGCFNAVFYGVVSTVQAGSPLRSLAEVPPWHDSRRGALLSGTGWVHEAAASTAVASGSCQLRRSIANQCRETTLVVQRRTYATCQCAARYHPHRAMTRNQRYQGPNLQNILQTTILRSFYNNATVTIDLQPSSNLGIANILQTTQRKRLALFVRCLLCLN